MSEQHNKWQDIKDAMDKEEQDSTVDIHEDSAPDIDHELTYPSHEELMQSLEAAEKRADENLKKAMLAMAECDNVRKRAEKDVQDALSFGPKKLLEALIPVIDSLEQALTLVTENTTDAMKEGLLLTLKMFSDVLEKNGVESINPEGQVFDPNLHEAMSMQMLDSVEPNTVIAVFQKGYALNGRIIRPARVVVSKALA